jgi:precorrin-6B methylase 2
MIGRVWRRMSSYVDVGGGVGSVSLALARAFPHLRFMVQDRKDAVIDSTKECFFSLFSVPTIGAENVNQFFEAEFPEALTGQASSLKVPPISSSI